MKAFITALAVFFAVTGFVVFASIHLSDSADELIDIAESLPKSSEEGGFDAVFSDLYVRWCDERGAIRYFIGHTESDAIEDTLDDLETRFHRGDEAGYASARKRLLSQLDRIRSDESFSCDSLF